MKKIILICFSMIMFSCFISVKTGKDEREVVLYNFTEKAVDVYVIKQEVRLNYFSDIGIKSQQIIDVQTYVKDKNSYKTENFFCTMDNEDIKKLDINLKYDIYTNYSGSVLSYNRQKNLNLIFPDSNKYVMGILFVERGKDISSGKAFCIQEEILDFDYKLVLENRDNLFSCYDTTYMKPQVFSYIREKINLPTEVAINFTWDKNITLFTYQNKIYFSPNDSIFNVYENDSIQKDIAIKNLSASKINLKIKFFQEFLNLKKEYFESGTLDYVLNASETLENSNLSVYLSKDMPFPKNKFANKLNPNQIDGYIGVMTYTDENPETKTFYHFSALNFKIVDVVKDNGFVFFREDKKMYFCVK